MPNRPVVRIDVDSEPFRRFKVLFDQYKKDVESTNAEWKAMVANSNAALSPLSEYGRQAAAAYGGLTAAITSAHGRMRAMLGTASSLAHTIERATKNIAKWTAIGAGIGGVGFLGMDALASGVLGRTREARGLGITVGQQSAFRVNQAPILGSPDTVLSNVALARQDYSKWWALQSLGVNPMAAQSQSPFDLSLQLEARARQVFRAHPNVQYAEARGLTQFFSVEDLRRMSSMSDKDFAASQAATRRDVSSLQFGSKQTSEWTQLAIQVHRAGLEIEKVFVDGLAPLAPELKKLSGAVVAAVGDFFKSGEAKEAIESLASGVKTAASYLSSPQFRSDVREFVDDFELVTRKIVSGLKALGVIPDDKAKADPSVVMSGPGFTIHRDDRSPWQRLINPIPPGLPGGPPANDIAPQIGPIVGGSLAEKESFLRGVEAANGLPAGILGRTWSAESGRGRFLSSSKGALGDFQFMPRTASSLGVDAGNFYSSGAGAGRYYRYLLDRFGGDPAKAAAAYNWGEGNLRRDIARYGAAWRGHLPAETSAYVDKVAGGGRGDPIERLIRVTRANRRANVSLRIHNNTAAQVAIQANNAVVP